MFHVLRRSSHREVLRKASLFSNPDHNDQDAERKKQEELEQQQLRKESFNKARAEFQQQQQEWHILRIYQNAKGIFFIMIYMVLHFY